MKNKKFKILFVILLALNNISNSQTNKLLEIKQEFRNVLYIIKTADSIKYLANYYIINFKNIELYKSHNIYDYKKQNEITDETKILEIILKPEIKKLYRINYIYKKFKIASKYKKYRLIIDRVQINKPNKIVADVDYIERLEINDKEKYVEIITKGFKDYLESEKNIR